MATASRTSGPNTRKARPGTGQAPTNYFSNNNTADTITGHCIQALIALAGINPERERLIASLAWKAPAHV